MALEPDDLTTSLTDAKVAIERGNYAKAVALLDPLCERYSPLQPPGDILRLLLATALMGQGQGDRAAACCRSLQRCADPQRRAQARDLLQVLEAPALKRPRDWSLTLPKLEEAPSLKDAVGGRSQVRQKPETPPPPPVGPTSSPRGFAAVVVAVLVALLLGSLLSGCLRVETELHVVGPGRVRLQHRLQPLANTPLPFQTAFSEALAAEQPPYKVTRKGATTLLSSPLLTPAGAVSSLQRTLDQASLLGGYAIPASGLDWRETNWLLGVSQHLQITLDLQKLPPLPGLDLSLRLKPFARRAIRQARPNNPVRSRSDQQAWIWPLQPGQVNHLVIRCWRWNPIALGGLVIALVLSLVVLLQRMRVRLGLGLPELPA